MFFDKYKDKKDGAIRGFDMHSAGVRIGAVIIMVICIGAVIVAIFPAVWVFLASFKTLKEFNNNVTLFPEHFDASLIKETWNAFKFTRYYKNSLIVVAGSAVAAVIFNGLRRYQQVASVPNGV